MIAIAASARRSDAICEILRAADSARMLNLLVILDGAGDSDPLASNRIRVQLQGATSRSIELAEDLHSWIAGRRETPWESVHLIIGDFAGCCGKAAIAEGDGPPAAAAVKGQQAGIDSPSRDCGALFRSLARSTDPRLVAVSLADDEVGAELVGLLTREGCAAYVSSQSSGAQAPRFQSLGVACEQSLSLNEMLERFRSDGQVFAASPSPDDAEIVLEQIEDSLPRIIEAVHSETDHDFLHYKTTTLTNRICSRMRSLGIDDVDRYADQVESSGKEAQELLSQLLVRDTRFFRDPNAFANLRDRVLRPLLQRGEKGAEPLRIWVAGCSSGEEAYSIAMLCHELCESSDRGVRWQIFATDLDTAALSAARKGVYSESIERHVSQQRRQRFFTRIGKQYQVTKELRANVLFSKHNVISDPPFSRVDLVSCRNLLVYLDRPMRTQLFSSFHYALNPGGFLFLGPADGRVEGCDLFTLVDDPSRIAKRVEVTKPVSVVDDKSRPPAEGKDVARIRQPLDQAAMDGSESVVEQLERELANTREHLVSSLQEMEAANEELRATNEDLLSLNEQLQRANDALESSKAVIRTGNEALAEANSDLENLLRSTRIATIFLDSELNIRGFTPAISEIYSLLESDIGRPLAAFKPNVLRQPPPLPSLKELEQGSPPDELIETQTGRWFIRRVLPYQRRTGESDGVVVTFVDITKRKQAEQALQTSDQEKQIGIEVAKLGLIRFDYHSNECHLSGRAAELYGFGDQPLTLHRNDWHAAFHPADRPAIIGEVEAFFAAGRDGCLAWTHRVVLPGGDIRWLDVRKQIFFEPGEGLPRASHGVLAARDVTEQKLVEAELNRNQARLLAEKQRLTEVLAEAEHAHSKLKVLFDQSAFYTGVVDLNGVLTDVNDSAIDAFDFSRDDCIGKKFWDTPWWTGHEQSRAWLRKVFPEVVAGKSFTEVLPYRFPGNVRRLSEFTYQPARNSEGQVTFIVVTGHDVTERILAEQELADSRGRLKMAMDAARMGAFEWEPESDLAYFSDGLSTITGLPAGQQPGKNFMACVHPGDLSQLNEDLDRAFKDTGEYISEFRFIRPDGDVRWFAARGKRVPAAEGRPVRLVGLNWDITESKEQQRRVIAGEERLRLALRAAKLRLWQWDVDHDQWYWSGEGDHLGKVMPNDHQGGLQHFLSTVHPDDRGGVETALRKSVSDGSAVRVEYRVRRDQVEGWAMSMANLSLQDEFSPTQMIGIELDITERKENELSLIEAREAAEAANKLKSNFLATMSHEIRTPMTSILGYTDLLFQQVKEPEAVKNLETVQRNGRFLLEIINDILDLSKIEAGKLNIAPTRFQPTRLIADVQSIMNVRAEENDLSLKVVYKGEIPEWIESDPKRIKQILVNLVGNAIKFTEQGGVTISVSFLDQPSPKVQFDVEDTGIGISEEQRKNLFRPFTQGDARINRHFGGTGLGLAISQRLARFLGGTITVRSAPGEGSTFSCRVSAGDIADVKFVCPSAKTELPKPHSQRSPIRLDKRRILVVDDRRDIRFLSKRLLVQAGAEVGEAVDGIDALEKVESSSAADQSYDLIVLDMQMPRLDGYRAAQQLRQMGFHGPILAVTAEAMEGAAEKCIQCGCNQYLSKPIDSRKFLAQVQSLLPPQS